jgi:hypothetical protein
MKQEDFEKLTIEERLKRAGPEIEAAAREAVKENPALTLEKVLSMVGQ